MISFTVPYPGAEASTNHGYHPVHVAGHTRLALTLEAKAFKREVTILAKQAIIAAQWHPAPGSRLWVEIIGSFPNRKHSDISNLVKFIQDCVEKALNCYVEGGKKHNDRDWGLIVRPPTYHDGPAELEIYVTK